MEQRAAAGAGWLLDPSITFLNHGSFGALPAAVAAARADLLVRLERDPVDFLARRLEPLLDEARAALGALVGARPEDLAFASNETCACNAVLRSLALAPGDEVLVTDHGYNAVANAARYACERAGATVTVARVPFPVVSPRQVVDAVLAALTARTRLAVVDHVTSQSAVVLPIEAIAAALRERGVALLVDGAHAPGMLALDLDRLGAEYYAGNCHKWLCAPKGAAFLHVRRDRQAGVHPLVVSHGLNSERTDRSRFRLEFDWQGTRDPTPWLCVPEAIRVVAALVPGGWPEVMARNRALALAARALLCERLGTPPACPPEMLGSMATVLVPRALGEASPRRLRDPLQEALWERHRIEVPAFAWPRPGRQLLRVSAQLYNSIDQYARLADALVELGVGPGGND